MPHMHNFSSNVDEIPGWDVNFSTVINRLETATSNLPGGSLAQKEGGLAARFCDTDAD